jgi:hypothetical protein
MMYRWMLIVGLAACGSSPGPTTTSPPPSSQGPAYLSADGTRVSAERVYEGDCMPAGSRGGCHTITLRPDGTYRNFLFDAAVNGTYVITGNIVKMTATEPAMTEELALSADGATLGTLPLKSTTPP